MKLITQQRNQSGRWLALAVVGLLFGFVGATILFQQTSGQKQIKTSSLNNAYPGGAASIAKAVQNTAAGQNKKLVSAVIVNHHLLAPNLIAETLAFAKSSNPSVILLVSPNHFSAGRAPFVTSNLDWATAFGEVKADGETVRFVGNFPDTTIENWPFTYEHGVSNIIPFLHLTFPQARIVPLLVKGRVPRSDAVQYARRFNRLLPDDALVVGSFDFTHDQPEPEAAKSDQRSLALLNLVNPSAASTVEVDSRPGLALVVEYARLRGAVGFNCLARSSAAEIVNQPDLKENVSYITGVFRRVSR